ncbi:Aminoglycoside phosphotransferase [Niveomyces insectorum RCEF 264]|uniref:Aminoglycoside phosphotransferase n=1 Tax=Niveomyces insectorum RCEF 264 TaxID=1081102 RepID=A0A167VLL8_9HYPO|nr:Aminoglycoside phosphotransferase [Niveomyces insectorum RCEF 264]
MMTAASEHRDMEISTSTSQEYFGTAPPVGVHLPTADEILALCDDHPRSHVVYPADSPVFWIKYDNTVFWNEVAAQTMAHRELRRCNSPVRAPAVYYAFRRGFVNYIVMEYIPGKTAGALLEESDDQAAKDDVVRKVAMGLSELHRIPVPAGSCPAAIDGGRIRHVLFDEREAPRHYEDGSQLELHFLEKTRRKAQLCRLAQEPLVFCFSDTYPDNFLLDACGQLIVVDFADVSILPSSFAKYAVCKNRFGVDMERLVHTPTTDPVNNDNDNDNGNDNTFALRAASGSVVVSPYFFAKLGRRMPGGDEEVQTRIEDAVQERSRAESY